MHKHTVAVGNLRDFCYRLQCTCFVIGVHNCNQYSLLFNRCLKISQANTPTPINRQICHAKAVETLKRATGIEHSRMLCHLGDDMVCL